MEVLDPAIVDAALADGMAWVRQGDVLVKTRRGKDFADSLTFVNAVALWLRKWTTIPTSTSAGTP